MAHLSRSSMKRRKMEILLGSLALLAALAVIAGVGYVMLNRPEELNSSTLCPAKGPKGHYVLLVDKTDPLTFTQKEDFYVTMRELIEHRIPEGYLLSVFVLDENFKENAKPLIELCNPGAGEGKSELTANIRQLKRQYQERFLNPLLNLSESLLAQQPAKISPIFEMLQLVEINSFRKQHVKGERRLIIMSDMLHNTPQFSMYKDPIDYATFIVIDYARKLQLDLRDVEVELLYLINSPQLQTKRNLKFWEDYFNKAGARIVAVRPMEG